MSYNEVEYDYRKETGGYDERYVESSWGVSLDRIDVLLLKAPPDAAGEDYRQHCRRRVREPHRREHRLVELHPVEDYPRAERVKGGCEVDKEEEDGHGDAEHAATQDHVHGQEVAGAVAEGVHLLGAAVAVEALATAHVT